jgi:S-adenosylmethionine synthetase
MGTSGTIVPPRPLATPRKESSAAPGVVKEVNFEREYPFVGRELRIMGMAAGTMLALMVILSFVLR